MSQPTRRRGARPVLVLAATATTAAVLCAAPSASADPALPPATAAVTTTGGGFVTVPSSRVIDTRTGVGAPKAKVGPGATITSAMTDRFGLPPAGGATAVVLNLVSVNSTALSYLTAWPADVPRPATSSLNVPAGGTRANLVTVPLHADGRVAIYNAFGTTDVVADVVGYYSSTDSTTYGGLTPLEPTRYYDSRWAGEGAFHNGEGLYIYNDFSDGSTDYNPDITGWVVNITAVNPTSDGYLTLWNGAGDRPGTSSVNFKRGLNSANLVEVGSSLWTDPDTSAELAAFRIAATTYGGGTVDIVADVVGVYTKPGTPTFADARFVPLSSPQRIVDTRKGNAPNLIPGGTRTFTEPLGTARTVALASNLTLAKPSGPTYVSVWAGGPKPGVSNVNAVAGDIVANGAVMGVTAGSTTGGSFLAYNNVGTTPFVVDVAGTFDVPPTTVAPGTVAPAAAADPSAHPTARAGWQRLR